MYFVEMVVVRGAAGRIDRKLIMSFQSLLAVRILHPTSEFYVLPAMTDCMGADCPTGLARMPQERRTASRA